MTRPMLDIALEAYACGLAVIPPAEDGSKRPDVPSWTYYQKARPTEDELLTWYGERERTGIGLVCGAVSGGLEMLEFEGTGVAEGVKDAFLADAQAAGLAGVIARIGAGYRETTPKGGLHLLYRVPTPRPNTKLARRPATDAELAADPTVKIRVLIETRGEGGYVVIAPSRGRVHPSGRPWVLKAGGFGSIATISDEERDALFDIARSLDLMPAREIRPARPVDADGERPGDRYNALPDIQARTREILERHGWLWRYAREGVDYLARPGKQGPGVSASLGKIAPGVLRVFTTSDAILEEGAHDPFGILARLEHGGDFQAAARALEPGVELVFTRPSDGSPAPSERPAEPASDIASSPFPEPEDRGHAVLSEVGETEYVEDLLRPGRIVVWAAEEGTGKSYTVNAELGIRVAVAGGLFAGTWAVLETGPVLFLSEMHTDDDYAREEQVLAALGKTRADLAGRYFRLPLMTAAGTRPALQVAEWRTWIVRWLRERGARLLIFDTATGAAGVEPWGPEITGVYRELRAMLEAYPALAIILIVHLKKPTGKGERRLSDVLGEWGRWNDVTVLHENDGTRLDRAKLTSRKRVRRERRIVVSKRDGLLVDPVDVTDKKVTTKVSAEEVLAAVAARPGLTYAELGTALGVSKSTAQRYAGTLGAEIDVVPGVGKAGKIASARLFPSSHRVTTSQERDDAMPDAMDGSLGLASSHRVTSSIEVTRDVMRWEPDPSSVDPEALRVAAERIFAGELA